MSKQQRIQQRAHRLSVVTCMHGSLCAACTPNELPPRLPCTALQKRTVQARLAVSACPSFFSWTPAGPSVRPITFNQALSKKKTDSNIFFGYPVRILNWNTNTYTLGREQRSRLALCTPPCRSCRPSKSLAASSLSGRCHRCGGGERQSQKQCLSAPSPAFLFFPFLRPFVCFHEPAVVPTSFAGCAGAAPGVDPGFPWAMAGCSLLCHGSVDLVPSGAPRVQHAVTDGLGFSELRRHSDWLQQLVLHEHALRHVLVDGQAAEVDVCWIRVGTAFRGLVLYY